MESKYPPCVFAIMLMLSYCRPDKSFSVGNSTAGLTEYRTPQTPLSIPLEYPRIDLLQVVMV
ncbi:Protein of unknown function [Pyronema omphalodes CBS 100304]|uniref:Uncharacterized protein n=1 Tax=Pyronema omphalodes (strain CBS 100304) TaxID=1076935 RepID=U4L9B8_PYROM|nr:Protein of unknown function [Pyronema omphalodes CBS 100304]